MMQLQFCLNYFLWGFYLFTLYCMFDQLKSLNVASYLIRSVKIKNPFGPFWNILYHVKSENVEVECLSKAQIYLMFPTYENTVCSQSLLDMLSVKIQQDLSFLLVCACAHRLYVCPAHTCPIILHVCTCGWVGDENRSLWEARTIRCLNREAYSCTSLPTPAAPLNGMK